MPENNLKKRIRNDIILVAVIVALALVGFIIFKATLKGGSIVTVSVDGKEEYRYRLDENEEFTVKTGENGESINVVVIENRKAYMKNADCPDKICVEHRPVSKVGETIVCLPHKLVVAVDSE